MRTKAENGFTLVELVVITGIIGILAATISIILNPLEQLQKGWDAQRKNDLGQIQRALEAYYQDFGKYPDNATNCSFQIKGDNGDGNDCISWGESWGTYMSKVPKDRNPAKKYVYAISDNGQTYRLYTSLDRGSRDPQACNSGAACSNVPAGASCGGVCNYGVSSSNASP